jgi:hypothetical protein
VIPMTNGNEWGHVNSSSSLTGGFKRRVLRPSSFALRHEKPKNEDAGRVGLGARNGEREGNPLQIWGSF